MREFREQISFSACIVDFRVNPMKVKQYGEYNRLKDDVKMINEVKRGVDEIVQLNNLDKAEQQRKRTQDMGL